MKQEQFKEELENIKKYFENISSEEFDNSIEEYINQPIDIEEDALKAIEILNKGE